MMNSVIQKELLVTVSKLYYLGDMTQNQIAQKLGLSRPKVSRLLRDAREFNVVQISIATPPSYYERMAETLKTELSLKTVIVVPSLTKREDSIRNVGEAAAEYIAEHLRNGMNIGLAWGSTVAATVNAMKEQPTQNIDVWQLTACPPNQQLNMDGQEQALRLASLLHGTAHLLSSPFFVQTPLLKKLLLEEPIIKEHFEFFNTLKMALVGLGSSRPEESMSYRSNSITLDLSKRLVDSGYAADICGHRIYKDAPMEDTLLTDRIIAIYPKQLRNIPDVIAVAAGSEKTASILAGARGKYIDTLIIDEIAAISTLQALQEEE